MDSYLVDLINELRTGLAKPLDIAQLAWLDRAAALGLGTRSYQLIKG